MPYSLTTMERAVWRSWAKADGIRTTENIRTITARICVGSPGRAWKCSTLTFVMSIWTKLAGIFLVCGIAFAQTETPQCSSCAAWNAPQTPFRIYGNTYYVGPHGLSSILITSDSGHILIDGGLAESAQQIAAHIRELGFRVEDVKLIVNSHVHFDHGGGISELQRLSGAKVAASPWSVGG